VGGPRRFDDSNRSDLVLSSASFHSLVIESKRLFVIS
jgi:hypothetical protein